jgi:hypothetical protein
VVDTVAADPVLNVFARPCREVSAIVAATTDDATADWPASSTVPASTPAASVQRPRAWSLVPYVVAAVLIGAGLLKTEKLWNEGMSEQSFIGSWGLVSLIYLELGAGLALLTNVSPRLLRSIALVLFAAFACVALSKVAAGNRSCSCAGNLTILPSLAVVGDLFIFGALWRWRPECRPGSSWLKAGLTLGLLTVAPWPLLAAFRPAPYPWLIVTPVIDLGQLAAGERRSFALRLENPHDQAVEIVAVESTCPCLESAGVPARVRPGEAQALDISLDLSREPAFVGPLSLKVTGRTANGAIAFATQLGVSVLRHE